MVVADAIDSSRAALPVDSGFADVDGVLELKDLSQQLIQLDCPEAEVIDLLPSKDPVEQSVEELRSLQVEGSPSIFTCPECDGTLFEVNRNGFTHYRCRVGHSYNPAALSTEQVHKTEAALWEGLKLLEENLSLSKRILSRLSEAGHQKSEKLYERRIRDTEERIALLQEVLRVGLAPGLEASEDAV